LRKLLYILVAAGLLACKHSNKKGIFGSSSQEEEFQYRQLNAEEKATYAAAIREMYDSMFERRGFNGSILVAKNGQVLFEDYRGFSDLRTKDSITPTTPFHLASTSKTFTGMAIMKLQEEKKLNIDDSLQVFFPEFPYSGITVRMLLSHRSGLPNYVYFMPADPAWKHRLATNEDML